MPDPTWPSSPPEVNHLRLVGPGAAGTATTMASAAAWQALVAGHEVAVSVSSLNTAATALNFEGVGGMSSTTAVTGLNASLQLLAGWTQEKPPIAVSAVWAHQTAVSSMIPAEVSIANRAEQAADVALNPLVLGALTPVIVALDAQYFGEYWPHNASAGAVYGAALAALAAALAVPPPISPPGASPTAPVTAAAAVARSAGQAAMGEALKESGQAAKLVGDGVVGPAGQAGSMMTQPIQAAASAMQPVLGMFQSPVAAVQGLAGLPQSMIGSLGGVAGGAFAREPSVPAAMIAAAGGPGALALGAGGGAGAVSAGAGTVGVGGGVGGGVPGPGLTSFTRPTSSFAAENSGGRPAGLKTGLLGVAELKTPGTSAMSGAAMPVPPAHAGMLGQGKDSQDKDGVSHARIVLGSDPSSGTSK